MNGSRCPQHDYDRIAAQYAEQLSNELEGKPRDRELLLRFVKDLPEGARVCDLGCGPGHVTRFLNNAGANVFGIDLSSEMLREARRRHPDIEFEQGDVFDLHLASGSLAAIVAFYSIVNFPRHRLSAVFREMHRVLQKDGRLLLAFHIGDEHLRRDDMWGVPVSLDFYFFPTAKVCELLDCAGFVVEEVVEREPYAPEIETPEPPRLHLCAVSLIVRSRTPCLMSGHQAARQCERNNT